MRFFLLPVLLLCVAGCSRYEPAGPGLTWPEIDRQMKPWTRWWWPGSSVDRTSLTQQLEAFADGGLGGVEITPVYGARGYEDTFIDYLSPEWTEMFLHTLSGAERVEIGVDMATGTGWNFGGPTVTDDDAPQRMVYRKFLVEGGETLGEPVTCKQAPFARFVLDQADEIRDPLTANTNLQQLAIDQVVFERELPVETLMGYSDNGEVVELTGFLDEGGNLSWTAPEGTWTIYAIFRGWTGKMVERAAPGGEGFMINHFSARALERYLSNFDRAFAGKDISGLRSFFSDSYEVDDAQFYCDWVPGFFEDFEKLRGYRLQECLPALLGEDEPDKNSRVLSDYRETINDLILEDFTLGWKRWANSQGKLIRNQAHGSPGNLLDLYAASDIPETEGEDILRMKFASSAAHVTGKKLVSSESATFLNENFTSTLLDLKKNLDHLFLGGVNHAFYHGTAFTPRDEPWPGWFFYVAIHLNPQNPIWRDLPDFNSYVAHTQSFLQSGQPQNDILIYFPVYDRYAARDEYRLRTFDGDGPAGRLIERFNVNNPGWRASSFRELAEKLQQDGYAADFISDRQLSGVKVKKNRLMTGGNAYRVIILPECTYIPLETFEQLLSLVRRGATLVVHRDLPGDVPGLGRLEERQAEFRKLLEGLAFENEGEDIRMAGLGKGNIYLGEDLDLMLDLASVKPEILVKEGIRYTRRKDADGVFYFLVNETEQNIQQWIPLTASAPSAALFDPMNRDIGLMATRQGTDGGMEVYLQLGPHQSCIVKTFDRDVEEGPVFRYLEPAGERQLLEGNWQIKFLVGGPELPPEEEMDQPASWTDLEGDAVKRFSGTAAYTLHFDKPAGSGTGWWLDLGRVAESARIFLNGEELGVLIGPEYRVYIDSRSIIDRNILEIQVTNLAANRIAYLDRTGVFWKKFYNNNIRPLRRENRGPDGMFTAAQWEPRPSGLLGPVSLTPVREFQP